jgi:hypothetical protein
MPFGLLDHWQGLQPGLHPGKSGVAQDLPLRTAGFDPLHDRLQARHGFTEPLGLGGVLRSCGLQRLVQDLLP